MLRLSVRGRYRLMWHAMVALRWLGDRYSINAENAWQSSRKSKWARQRDPVGGRS